MASKSTVRVTTLCQALEMEKRNLDFLPLDDVTRLFVLDLLDRIYKSLSFDCSEKNK